MEQNNGSKPTNNNGDGNKNNQKNNSKHFGGHYRPNRNGKNRNKNDNNRQNNNAKPTQKNDETNNSVNRAETVKQESVQQDTPTLFNELPEEDLIFFPDAAPPKVEPKYTFTEAELDEILAEKEQIVDDRPHTEIIGIRFKKVGKMYYFDPNGLTAKAGDSAIVETARGLEFGQVCLGNRNVPTDDIVQPLRPVIRIATPEDIAHNKENSDKEQEAFRICLEKIAIHELDMKLVDAQFTFDNTKLIFYFTSAGRVDFRELVKDLASVFRIRIELRQIGIRDEAKLMGGLGVCGRPLCCASFLSDFVQVSIKMAKEQSLSLNSTKISGTCGRLMCCLRYEYDTYQAEIANTPPVESVVDTPDGRGTVIEISPLAGTVRVRLAEKQDVQVKTYRRELCKIISVPVLPDEKNH